MAGSTNFKVFNPNLTNMMDDNTYNTSGYRLNGAVSGLAPSNVHNKLYYQVTTMVAAFAQALANKGFTVSDDNFNNLVTVLSNIALKTDNVASATKLQTARKINSVPFDGSTDIILTPANIGAAPDGFGVGKSAKINNVNANYYKNTGDFYFYTGCSNVPNDYCTISVVGDGTEATQTALGVTTGIYYTRSCTASQGWSAWKQTATMDLVAPSGYGLGPDSVVITNTDLNTSHNSGFYYAGSGCTNRPPGAGNGHLLTMDNSDQVSWQRYTDSTTGFGYERYWYSGAWSAWKQIATADMINRVWISSEYAPVINTPTIINHSLTIDPMKCKCDALLKCISADNGYNVGDYAISPVEWPSTGSTEYPMNPLLTATTIQLNTGYSGIWSFKKSDGTHHQLDLTKWRYIFRIWY
jgi:hypothetical protein